MKILMAGSYELAVVLMMQGVDDGRGSCYRCLINRMAIARPLNSEGIEALHSDEIGRAGKHRKTWLHTGSYGQF